MNIKNIKYHIKKVPLYASFVLATVIGAKVLTAPSKPNTEEALAKLREINSKKYESTYESYEEYVRNIAIAIKNSRHGDTGIVKDFTLYQTMYLNGYLSIGDKFTYDEDVPQLYDNLGLNVAYGSGVCRHVSTNLKDVLNELGYDATYVAGELYKPGEKAEDKVNHGVVYVEEKGVSYLLDPINNTIYLRGLDNVFYQYDSIKEKAMRFKPEYELYQDLYYRYGNDFRKHRKYTKQHVDYQKIANEHLEYYQEFEKNLLLDHEFAISEQLNELKDELGSSLGK